MKPAENIEKLIKKLHVAPNPQMQRQTLNDALQAQQKSKAAGAAISHSHIYEIIIRNPITKLAGAAVIIIAVGLFLVYSGPGEQVETPKVAKAAKSPAGLTTVISLEAAYRRGGLEAVEQQCDKAVRILGARLDGISAGQLIRDFNIEKQEREKP